MMKTSTAYQRKHWSKNKRNLKGKIMREIKFRAWDKIEMEMCEVDTLNWNMKTAMLKREGVDAYGILNKNLILMQYTGLKDEKRTEEYPDGQPIYESDVVEASIYSDEKPQELTVQWRKGAFVIDYEDSEYDCVVIGEFVGSLEVIGNIHEKDLTGNQNPDIVESYGIQNDKSSQKSDKQCPARASSKSENKTENRDCESKKDKA